MACNLPNRNQKHFLKKSGHATHLDDARLAPSHAHAEAWLQDTPRCSLGLAIDYTPHLQRCFRGVQVLGTKNADFPIANRKNIETFEKKKSSRHAYIDVGGLALGGPDGCLVLCRRTVLHAPRTSVVTRKGMTNSWCCFLHNIAKRSRLFSFSYSEGMRQKLHRHRHRNRHHH